MYDQWVGKSLKSDYEADMYRWYHVVIVIKNTGSLLCVKYHNNTLVEKIKNV